MSTWTNEKHEAARARCAAATGGPWAPWLDQDGADHMNGLLMVGNAGAVIPDGESWVEGVDVNPIAHTYTPEDREFIAHARADIPALLDEIERLRALTTITNDMVDRAAREIYGPARWDSDIFFARSPNSYWPHLAQGIYDARDKARAALEAALTTKENES